MSTDPTQIMQQPAAPAPPTDLNSAVTNAAKETASNVATQLVAEVTGGLQAGLDGLAARLTTLENTAAPVLIAGVTQDISAVTANVVHDTWLKRVLAIGAFVIVGAIILTILVSALLGNATAQRYVNEALAGAAGLVALIANVEGVTLPTKTKAAQ